jgi:hypothetical protein
MHFVVELPNQQKPSMPRFDGIETFVLRDSLKIHQCSKFLWKVEAERVDYFLSVYKSTASAADNGHMQAHEKYS